MTNFSAARRNMVLSQVRTDDVTDERIQDAMNGIPREIFLPTSRRAAAYTSSNVELGQGRYLMEPRAFSKLAQDADIAETDLVLVIGCGTGYSVAVFSKLADTVVGLECDEVLAETASSLLLEQDIDNAVVVTGELSGGYAGQGPYDVIFIDGAVSEIPPQIIDQLKEGGRLAAIVDTSGVGRATILTKSGAKIGRRTIFDASVPYLPGFEPDAGFSF